eukprot:COSAG02_NODE_2306_length_9174_cov_10.715152_8_plen_266_part_00
MENPLTEDSATKTDINTLNLLAFWTVFDASSGIFIEDWGVPEQHWDESLWGKLGFTYDQMHTRGHRQDRATNTSVVMSPASTNADVNSTQTMGWCVNIYGAPQYLSQLPVMGTSSDLEKTYTEAKDKDHAASQTWNIGSISLKSSFRMSEFCATWRTDSNFDICHIVSRSFRLFNFIRYGIVTDKCLSCVWGIVRVVRLGKHILNPGGFCFELYYGKFCMTSLDTLTLLSLFLVYASLHRKRERDLLISRLLAPASQHTPTPSSP